MINGTTNTCPAICNKNLGISEIIANPENIVIIEWPEVAAKMLSGATLNLDFKTAGKNGRQIEISG